MAGEKNSIIIPITLVAEGGGSNGTTDNTNPVGQQSQEQQNDVDKKQKKAAARAQGNNAAKAIISHVASQTVALALNGYGDITGNYVQGQNLQLAVSEAGKIAGAISMGWVGVVLYAVDKGVQAFNYASEMKKSEMQSAFAQKRVYGTTVKS